MRECSNISVPYSWEDDKPVRCTTSIGAKEFTGHLHDSYILGETGKDFVASRVDVGVDSDANRGTL